MAAAIETKPANAFLNKRLKGAYVLVMEKDVLWTEKYAEMLIAVEHRTKQDEALGQRTNAR